MEFNPPIINHIDDVLPHIKDKPEIIHIVKDDYQVLDYVYILATTFDNPYAKECRGLKFDRDGNLIGRPYHKFKNLGEDEEYSTTRVDLSLRHVRLDKLDGSMVHNCVVPYVNKDGNPYRMHKLMTRKGESEVAKAAQEWLFSEENIDKGITDAHMKMWGMYPEYTFIYEYIGPTNKIVIDYPETNLILTGMRNTQTGDYINYNNMFHIAEYFKKVDCVGIYDNLDVANDTEKEGCIIRFNTGAMVKMKSDIYIRKHRSKDLVTNFKDLVKLIVEGNLDDILPQLDEETFNRVTEYNSKLMGGILTLAKDIQQGLKETKDLPQKEFAFLLNDKFSKNIKSIYFASRKSNTPSHEILRCIQKASSDTTRLTDLFEELKLPIWKGDFFKTE